MDTGVIRYTERWTIREVLDLGKNCCASRRRRSANAPDARTGVGNRLERDGCRVRIGSADRPFEEQHTWSSIAVVVSGTFQYRSSAGEGLMVPGSLLLGNARDGFVCAHEHGTGDRCVAFSYSPELLSRLGEDLGVGDRRFDAPRLPPARVLAPFVAAASTLLACNEPEALACEAVSLQLAARVMTLDGGLEPARRANEPAALKRVNDVVRMMEREPTRDNDATRAGRRRGPEPVSLSEKLQRDHRHDAASVQVLRARLRRAAVRLRVEDHAHPRHCARVRLRRSIQLQSGVPRGVWDKSARLPARLKEHEHANAAARQGRSPPPTPPQPPSPPIQGARGELRIEASVIHAVLTGASALSDNCPGKRVPLGRLR